MPSPLLLRKHKPDQPSSGPPTNAPPTPTTFTFSRVPPPPRRSSYPPWSPPDSPSARTYYSLTPPIFTYSHLHQTLLPVLRRFLLFPNPDLGREGDPTWGRYAMPFSPREDKVRGDKRFKVEEGRVWTERRGRVRNKARDGDEVKRRLVNENGDGGKKAAEGTSDEEQGDTWVWYQIWQLADEQKVRERNCDLVYCHGINDYGGKFAEHALPFLLSGYRLILPDLPSHGRSTGLHAYNRDLSSLSSAVRSVLSHVLSPTSPHSTPTLPNQGRKLIIAGASMGGFTALTYALRYARGGENEDQRKEDGLRGLDGVMLLAPMLGIAKTARPNIVAEYAGRLINLVGFSRFPMFEANRGKNSFDPRLDSEFLSDPQTYHGLLRVGTALGCLEGIDAVEKLIRSGEAKRRLADMPWRVIHGTSDRVTSWAGSVRLATGLNGPGWGQRDKEAWKKGVEEAEREGRLRLYEGYEHVMMRTGDDEEDDEPRQVIIRDMMSFFEKCCNTSTPVTTP